MARFHWSPENFVDRLYVHALDGCSLHDFRCLCRSFVALLKEENPVRDVPLPAAIVGNVYGDPLIAKAILVQGQETIGQSFVFLGNYLGDKKDSLLSIGYIFGLKVTNPSLFTLLRGARETEEGAKEVGFLEELVTHFGEKDGTELFLEFVEVFNWLPLAATVAEKVFCVHGGVSPEMRTINDVRKLPRPLSNPLKNYLSNDLLYMEPDVNVDFYMSNPTRENSLIFGEEEFLKAAERIGMQTVVRSGMGTSALGFDTFAYGKLLLLDSNPKECAAYLFIDEEENCFIRMLVMKEITSANKAIMNQSSTQLGAIGSLRTYCEKVGRWARQKLETGEEMDYSNEEEKEEVEVEDEQEDGLDEVETEDEEGLETGDEEDDEEEVEESDVDEAKGDAADVAAEEVEKVLVAVAQKKEEEDVIEGEKVLDAADEVSEEKDEVKEEKDEVKEEKEDESEEETQEDESEDDDEEEVEQEDENEEKMDEMEEVELIAGF